MKKQITHISVLQTSKIVALMYFVVTLLAIPFGLMMFFKGNKGGLFFLAAPLIYAALGFILIAIISLLYNVIAKRFGGIEFNSENIES